MRMHRRLFVWFGMAIVATGATVIATVRLFGDTGHAVWAERFRVDGFLNAEYARAWPDPVARHALSESLAQQLALGVRVTSATGEVLDRVDAPNRCRTPHEIAVRGASGVPLGAVSLCLDRYRMHAPPWSFLLALFAAGTVLWGIAGRVSRRISRPLSEVASVAREIGEGNLASRVGLCQHYHGEVGELSEAINDMAERIERQLRDQRELLATVSHELRTPLQRIRILLELAADKGTDRKILDEIDSEVVEMDALVGDLLASARLDFAALSPRALDAADIARRAAERAGLPEASVRVDDGAGTLMADATLLSRALAAVFDNARKYGGETITLRVRPSNSDVVFEVDDNGRGFAPGDEEKVLQPFYRGSDRGAEDARGVGLGLALVSKIAAAHGGRVFARNLPEGGARVGIEIPREPRARRPA